MSFFYLRDIDVYDFTIGFMSGIFKRDDSHLWGGCVETIPEMILAYFDVYGGFKFEDPESVFLNIEENIEDLGHWGNVAVAVATRVFKLFSISQNCISFGEDIGYFFEFI